MVAFTLVAEHKSGGITPAGIGERCVAGGKQILLIVGNGFTISFWQTHRDTLARWHPSRPLSFELPTPGDERTPLLDNLPRLKTVLERTRAERPDAPDFDLLRDALAYARGGESASSIRTGDAKGNARARQFVELESRHFLAIAYSHFHSRTIALSRDRWSWQRWFLQHRDAAFHVVSLNYEMTLEMTLASIGRLGQPQWGIGRGAVVVFKPHGSINYDLRIASRAVAGYPLRHFIGWNDGPVFIIPGTELYAPRVEPVAVLPHERSMYVDSVWNRGGFQEYKRVAPDATHVVIVGISYTPADRPEIDYFLDRIPRTAILYVVDPNPSTELLEAITRRDLTHVLAVDPPDLEADPTT